MLNNDGYIVTFEIAPIAFSSFGDFDPCHDKHAHHLHTRHANFVYFIDANGDVHKRRYVMMDDVFLYNAHTFSLVSMMCVGTLKHMSTSTEHELTKRALERDHEGEESRTTLSQGGR